MEYSQHGIFIEDERLAAYGENAARSIRADGLTSGKAAAKSIQEDLRRLRAAHHALAQKSKEEPVDPAQEWLLDNWYLAVREGQDAADAFRHGKRLHTAGKDLRIFSLATTLLRAGAGQVSQERCALFLDGFQQVSPLSREELGLFVPALIGAAVHALAGAYTEQAPTEGEYAGKLFTTLRLLGTLDLSGMLEQESVVEQILRQDPAGVYPLMAESTRDAYRRKVSLLAQEQNTEEYRIARRVVKLSEGAQNPTARHVGYYLFKKPLGRKAEPTRGTAYVAVFLLSTLFISLLVGFHVQSILGTLLLLIPVSELVKNLIDFLLTKAVSPRHIPRMELRNGIPPEGTTVCVVSALLTGEDAGRDAAKNLEEFYLSNRDCGENLLFGILADLKEANKPELPEDQNYLLAAKEAIDRLNRKYGGGFYLFYRERAYNGRDGRWCGHERKRGALLALANLIETGEGGLITLSGDTVRLRDAAYILTLDADTRLCPGTARELVGAMLHPLNQPVLDEKTGVVTSGYGLIHPRISVDLTSATATDFARIFAGQGGTDPYTGGCGELYMDLFDRGGFAGKGILHAKILAECSKHLPEGRILSHDALEGAYLHGGYLWDVELTDGFPGNPISYMKRLERWTRGDWQNIAWAFRERGGSLCDIDRFKLLDSLRRSLVAPATFLCLLCGFLLTQTGPIVAAWAAFIALLSRFLLTLAETSVRKDQERKVRYHSAILHGGKGALVVTASRLILLPWEAWVTFSAICKALWRMTISKRDLLSWETFAQTGGKKGGFLSYLQRLVPSILTGLALMILPCAVIGKAVGILWLVSPLFAFMLAQPKRKEAPLSGADRAYLRERAAEIWQYFADFCTEEDHYLPPDNVQEQPPRGAAHRTSPTNIGLAMTSALTAADLGLDDAVSCEVFIERILTTLEQMPKWNGHLYNWYDTRTLESLSPAYVSTVDSGNLAASLITVASGMEEYGRPDLADRARRLFEDMDFSPLYDPSRHLFTIGMDLTSGKLSQGWYDLLSSEARLTGYVAIAKGDVPRKHWRHLSRALVAKDGYRGMASWSGSMFEYLMPELFLPLCRDSLLYETAKFCVYVQRRRVPKGHPWGISESAFFALDTALNYRYKAHGCAALALKRGMDDDLVISPYSSFLTLPVIPAAAVKNLRKIQSLSPLGTYGFYEALDFTPSRCRTSSGETVRCYMAHHLGMSMVAIGNLLHGNANIRRFLADPAMAAHQCLLEEKVPIGGTVLRRRSIQTPLKPPRLLPAGWQMEDQHICWTDPACCVLSNGSYTLLADEAGHLDAASQDVTIYRREDAPFTVCVGKTEFPLLPRPEASCAYAWEFSSRAAVYRCDAHPFSAETAFAVSAVERGEVRIIEFTAKHAIPDGALLYRFQPVLAFTADMQSHPAYCRLGLRAKLQNNTLIISRAARNKLPALHLALSCSVPMAVDEPLGDLADPTLTIRIPFSLQKDAMFDLRFTLCTAVNEQAAVAGSRRMLIGGQDDLAALPESAGVLLHMTSQGSALAMELLRALRRPTVQGTLPGSRAHLWKYGISGDFPILFARIQDKAQQTAAADLIRCHGLLNLCGVKFDLVLSCGGGDYLNPTMRYLESTLTELGLDSSLNARGGVHLLPDSDETAAAVLPFAAVVTDLSSTFSDKPRTFDVPPPTFVSDARKNSTSLPTYTHADDHSFRFTVQNSLPPRAWSNILTDGALSWCAADAGIGHLWYQNAALYRITPWDNDPYAVKGPETLEYLPTDGLPVSLFAANDGLECTVTYGFGWARWEKHLSGGTVTTTAFVPADTAARVFLIQSELSKGALRWRADLQLGESRRDAPGVETWQDGAALCARNPASVFPETVFRAVSDPPFQGFTCDRISADLGKWDNATGAGISPCFSMNLPMAKTMVLVCGCAETDALLPLTQPEAAFIALEQTRNRWQKIAGRLMVQTPDEGVNPAMNGWTAYQAVAGRILARSSLYQGGGAFGFRDQLQDAVNLILIDPSIAAEQIPACCARQYREGDVQHWWHLPEGRGIRSWCSDDLLWLPWALCEYVEKTGDLELCRRQVPYLDSPPLSDTEHDRYELALTASETDSVLDHSRRALDRVLSRGEGEHGLLLMLGGDWNDGMGAVGKDGRGESVWLTWFFAHTAQRFATLLDRFGSTDGEKYRQYALRYGKAAEQSWDGGWYRRGYYDDGTPLGSAESTACQIDSIAQSWAVMSPGADPAHRKTALDNALMCLFDREHRIVKLFDPPLPPEDTRAGYLSGYGPGFRENGGQYTHGAIWLAMACFREHRPDDGWAILRALWPEGRDLAAFQGEPFVIPADVYSNPNAMGMAGWTWYTGSAGWYFRVFSEELLGLRLENGALTIAPNLPSDWDGYSAVFCQGDGTALNIRVRRDGTTVNGQPYVPGTTFSIVQKEFINN